MNAISGNSSTDYYIEYHVRLVPRLYEYVNLRTIFMFLSGLVFGCDQICGALIYSSPLWSASI